MQPCEQTRFDALYQQHLGCPVAARQGRGRHRQLRPCGPSSGRLCRSLPGSAVHSTTGETAYRSLPLADFLWKLLRHVLRQGFHRVREYGFLHPRAKTRLRVVQLLLHVVIVPRNTPAKSPICCPRCQSPMRLIGVSFRGRPDG